MAKAFARDIVDINNTFSLQRFTEVLQGMSDEELVALGNDLLGLGNTLEEENVVSEDELEIAANMSADSLTVLIRRLKDECEGSAFTFCYNILSLIGARNSADVNLLSKITTLMNAFVD